MPHTIFASTPETGADSTLKAVIFDMDGLMFDTEVLNMKGWKAAGKRHGYEMSDELIHSHIGANVETTKRLMREHFGDGFDFDAVRGDRIDYVFRFIEENGMPLKPGLKELLTFLERKGLKTAIASSSEERFVRFYLDHARLEHKFDVLICGNMVKKSKPEPDIFLLALSMLGATAEETLVLEDSYNGIRAARRAGIRSIMVPDLLPSTPEMEALFFRRADDLLGVIPLIEPLIRA
jgi:HAD superfamily hydrolase (TIGR01509 family)